MKTTNITKTKERGLATLQNRKLEMDLNDHDDKVLYVAMKDDSNSDEATALVSYVNKSDKWIIDSGCSHHITRDKSKLITLNYYDRNIVRFGNDPPCLIK